MFIQKGNMPLEHRVSSDLLEIFRMKAREGDIVETRDGNIFDVKGLVHPSDQIIAFIRFTPDPTGERKRGNIRYRKIYPLHERFELLGKEFPQYLVFDSIFDQWLCEVPVELVEAHHDPIKYLDRLRVSRAHTKLEAEALQFAQLLQSAARVRSSALGVTGSLLAGLSTEHSDIDLIVYGARNCRSVHTALKSMISGGDSRVRSYSEKELEPLFDFRSKDTAMRFEDFVRTESRKVLQGKFGQRDYFIRCVKEWTEVNENYGDIQYKQLGQARIEATIAGNTEMIFTPCSYQVENVKSLDSRIVEPIEEIASFRGRFCEQVTAGEKVSASGTVERAKRSEGNEHYRLVIGNRPSDVLIPLQ